MPRRTPHHKPNIQFWPRPGYVCLGRQWYMPLRPLNMQTKLSFSSFRWNSRSQSHWSAGIVKCTLARTPSTRLRHFRDSKHEHTANREHTHARPRITVSYYRVIKRNMLVTVRVRVVEAKEQQHPSDTSLNGKRERRASPSTGQRSQFHNISTTRHFRIRNFLSLRIVLCLNTIFVLVFIYFYVKLDGFLIYRILFVFHNERRRRRHFYVCVIDRGVNGMDRGSSALCTAQPKQIFICLGNQFFNLIYECIYRYCCDCNSFQV